MPPFVDAAPTRRFEWPALGIDWTITWPNSLHLTLIAEQFIAVLQLLTADLASFDLYILPGRVEVDLRVESWAKERRLRRVPNNEASVWEMVVPHGGQEEDRDQRHWLDVTQSIMLLHEVSLRPEKWPIVERFAAQGPFANTMVGEQYTTLCRRLCDMDVPVLASEHRDPNLGTIYLRKAPHPELSWNTDLVDEYDADQVEIWLRNRYERFGTTTQLTLPRLLSNRRTRSLLELLRAEGWLDWHILGAVSGTALSYRVGLEFDPRRGSQEELTRLFDRYTGGEEQKAWPEVPLESFTAERLRFQMTANTASTVKGAGLVCRQQTPNGSALLEFVRYKMRYFDDDISHEDIFAESE